MNHLITVAAILTLSLAGVGVLRFLWPRVRHLSAVTQLSLGYFIGGLFVTVICMAAYLTGLRFSRPLLIVPVVVAAVLGVRVIKPVRLRRRPDFWQCAVMLLVLLACGLALARPIHGYDALSMWTLKAKMMFHAQTWPATMFDRFTTHHTEYPPLVPCVQAFVSCWMRSFDDVALRLVFAAFYAAGAGLLWWWFGLWETRLRGMWVAWWCALPLAIDQVKITYADLPLAAAVIVFVGAFISWLRDSARGEWLTLASIFAGLAFWIKPDALIAVGSGYLVLLLVAPQRGRVVRAMAVSAVIAAPWPLFVWMKNLPSDFGSPSGDVGLILRKLFSFAVFEGGYAFFWPMFIVLAVLGLPRFRNVHRCWAALTILLQLLGVIAVYMCSTLDLAKQLDTSADRVLLTVFVTGLFLAGSLWQTPLVIRHQSWLVAGLLLTTIVMVGVGWCARSNDEIFGITISAYPLALSWVWIVVGLLTLWRFRSRLQRMRLTTLRTALSYAMLLATIGLTFVTIGLTARDVAEWYRRFAGAERAPHLAATMTNAMALYPAGTHVRVLPKAKRAYHEFHYEMYPRLIVDGTAENVIRLPVPSDSR